MQDVTIGPEPVEALLGPRRYWAIAMIMLLVPLIVVAGSSVSGMLAPKANPAVVPSNPGVEAKWGIRVSQVAATADGGLVDFRFVVLDADKAGPIMHDLAALPLLKPEGSGLVISSTSQMTSHADLHPGETYFLLYRNTAGSIKPGTLVTVVFGDGQKIEHIVAR